jgi:hypothetical protein
MTPLRKLVIASLSVAVLAGGTAQAASTSDFSDQWWVPSESGWGASVQQQASTLFIDLMVYASDGKPAWFVAALSAGQRAGAYRVAGDQMQPRGRHLATFDPRSSKLERSAP